MWIEGWKLIQKKMYYIISVIFEIAHYENCTIRSPGSLACQLPVFQCVRFHNHMSHFLILNRAHVCLCVCVCVCVCMSVFYWFCFSEDHWLTQDLMNMADFLSLRYKRKSSYQDSSWLNVPWMRNLPKPSLPSFYSEHLCSEWSCMFWSVGLLLLSTHLTRTQV